MTLRRVLFPVISGFLVIASLTMVQTMSGVETSPPNRSRVEQLFRDGNWKEAWDGYRALCLDPGTDAAAVARDFINAVQCLRNLGLISEFDALAEGTVAAHAGNWRLLHTVASQYQHIDKNGFIIAGKFERGPHRGGGNHVQALARDRVRSLQLMRQALPLAMADDQKADTAAFLMDFAGMVQQQPYGQSYQLQRLTNLDELPDYDSAMMYGFWGQVSTGAPVAADGQPVFYHVPDSWAAASSDGERWRWLLAQVDEVAPDRRNDVRWHLAEFLWQQFGVQTLQEMRILLARSAGEPTDSGRYALHTLGEQETIARLATGIKRFELPDEFNFIRIYQAIVAEPRTGHSEDALNRLAEIFENRRQYPQAAEHWKRSIALHGPGNDNWKRKRLDQIVGNWGQFEPVSTQPEGQGATVEFRFRNATQVSFEARRIDVAGLLAEVKRYLRSNPARFDWSMIQIQNIGSWILQQPRQPFIGERVATWKQTLSPLPQHFDRRITITTPLREAGAYLVTASLPDGNRSTIVLWVDDMAIVHQTLAGGNHYFVADAVTGAPIPGANVEFFGFRPEAVRNNRPRVVTKNFAELTNRDGQLVPSARDLADDYQWLVIARTKEGRFAHLGFNSVWTADYHDAQYNEVKVYCITDRPVYRPGQKVHYKFWIRHAQYDNDRSNFAGQTFPIELHDPRGEKIQTWSHTSDAYAGLEGEWEIPNDATLGTYQLLVTQHGGGSFRVEEYKKPEFEVTVQAPDEPVKLGEKIEARINAKYYFGAPVTQATVKYKVTRQEHSQQWYPAAPWDWCFGRGYWWYAYDYTWYPGWNRWAGCLRPSPWWWPMPVDPPEVVAEREVAIGADGTLVVEIDTQVAQELHGDSDHRYTITAEVRDESRRIIVGQGDVLVTREPFKVFSWVDRGYYRVGDTVNASFLAQTLDNRPVTGQGVLKLLQIQYPGDKEQPVETEVQRWDLDTNEEGRASQQLRASRGGQYRLSYAVTDQQGHTIEGGYIFTIMGEGYDGREFHFNHLELIPDQQDYSAGDTVKLQINTDRAGSTVLLFTRPANGVYLPPQLIRLQGKSTVVDIPVTRKDMPNFFVEAVTVADGKIYTETRDLIVPPEKRVLNIAVVPNSETYKPGEKAKVKIHVTDYFGENFVGQTVAAVYDKAVEYVSGGSNVPDIKEFFWKWRREHHPQHDSSLDRVAQNIPVDGKSMQPIGVFGSTVADDMADARNMMMGGMGMGGGMGGMPGHAMMRGAVPLSAMAADAEMAAPAAAPMAAGMGMPGMNFFGAEKASGAQPGGELVTPTVRTNFADTALWVGQLETDQNGLAEISVDMPENLTTWKIRVWGMGHGTQVGSGDAEVITRKDLIVRLQAPRFFIQKDEVVLSANIHNYLAQDKQVTAVLEVDGNLLRSLGETTTQVRVPADGEQRVDWRVAVVGEGQATIRVKALTDEESDAMEMQLPSYVHGILKTESFAGTVRPDQPQASVRIRVPEERRVEQSRLEVRYSPTLAGAMVDALPYLAEYPYGCTEQTLNRFLPTVITQKVLMGMNLDLAAIREKRTNLNAQEIGDDRSRMRQWQRFDRNPVFDQSELGRMVKDGVTALTNMQCQDGGWGWFSGWREHSAPHTTAVVVHGLQIARDNDVAIVPGVIERGLEWLKQYESEQIQMLQNASTQKRPWKNAADNMDAFVHMILSEAGSAHGEMREFLYRDRNGLSAYGKTLLGLALRAAGNDHADELAMVMRNLEQFLVQDEENETAYLRLPENSYWWYWYGSDIEANAWYLKLLSQVDPQGRTAPRLVKYLLNNRKHATYWNSTRDTAYCVEAFATYLRATGETQPNMVVEIWLDGAKRQEVRITPENLFSFDNQFVLAGADVTSGEHVVEIRRRGDGPVYFNAYLTNFTLEDPITKAGLEVKVQRKYYRLVPEDKTATVAGSRGQAIDQRVEKYRREPLENLATVTSGELVEVELEIESKNDYEYVIFEDWKAAGFEAVELQSGYTGNGLGAYTEYRDNRVTFFIRSLARGQHSVSYRLHAEIPGRFAALPAQAAAMYAPELKGNSDEIKLEIVD